MTYKSLTGTRFGRLIVIERAPDRGYQRMWKCLCDCGGELITWQSSLIRGMTASCGCIRNENNKEIAKIHGHAGRAERTPEYKIWQNMIQRCTNTNNPGYTDYGARGIRVCARWLNFQNFINDVGLRPSNKNTNGRAIYSLDRINNNGDYEPGNVKWATQSEQSKNTRRSRKYDKNLHC